MQDHAGKTFPRPTFETFRYWEGCHNHELLIQKCSECGQYQFYPRLMCTNCSSRKVDWVKASGQGRVKSFTIIHRAISKAYLDKSPYVLALIELEEGPVMMSNLVNIDPQEIVIGMDVEVVFEDWSDEITIPKFCPLPS